MLDLKKAILNTVGPRLLSQARISGVYEASKNFRFIEIEADFLKRISFLPGEKVQINVGGWNLRTYTPISLDKDTGSIGILAYLHGRGEGSDWAKKLKPGATCQLLGPRRSLKISALENKSLVVFGDETTLGVAISLKRYYGVRQKIQFIFECAAPQEVAKVAHDLGLGDVSLFQKFNSGLLSEELAQTVVAKAAETEHVLLTGRAQSIQQVRKKLKDVGVLPSSISVQPYWSEGRKGLD